MGIFDKISHAIFGTKTAAAAPVTPAAAAPAAPVEATVAVAAATVSAPVETAVQPAAAAPASHVVVDVAAMLDAAVAAHGQKLDWRHSIVDLMKAVGMESTLAERKELAGELHYTGDTHDSAAMNIWLHKALLQKLAENGGHVPADMLK